jgi:D-alanine-D-alanine ligase-like ATP-grasp enzyme
MNMQWGQYYFNGAPGTNFWIPDSAKAQFDADPGPTIAGLTWVTTNDMFKIVATGTGSITGGNQATSTVNVILSTGLTFTPAIQGYLEIAGRVEILPRIITSSGATVTVFDVLRMYAGVVNTNQTQVFTEWDTSLDRTGDTLTYRFFVLEKVAF